ncbi:MAG: hypothetical protein NZ519_09300 [Bacteroidia bacterium]|nr:hypothetical protein [Bacteroidia bacterium]MDW8302413.1 hypothetical protein [Bacteroidia bacterium]
MTYSKKWIPYALLSLLLHALVLIITRGFWVELDSPAFVELAQTQSLSFCKPIGYPAFLFVFGIGAKYLWVPIFVQIISRSTIIGLIICFLQKEYQLNLKKTLLIWAILHIEPQQIYYNICLMVESLLLTFFFAQWYVWQLYLKYKQKKFFYLLLILIGIGLYFKPVALISVILLFGYGLYTARYQYILGSIAVYGIFYISTGSLYYWRYGTFETDIFKGILLWNNASVVTPVLKKDKFITQDEAVNAVLIKMYGRNMNEFSFEQNDNRIFEDSSFVQVYLQSVMSQGKDYRLAIVEVNRVLGRVGWQIVIHYPATFVKGYIIPNLKEWFLALFTPNDITYLVPSQIASLHPSAKTYKLNSFLYVWHSVVKIGLLSLFLIAIIKKLVFVRSIQPIFHFVWVYLVINVVLHPLEYRYIQPILGSLLLLISVLICVWISKNTDSILNRSYL